jgi:hypothetical protein
LGLLPTPDGLDLFPPALAAARRSYDDLRERFLVAPDGRWAADCTGGEGYAVSSPKTAWVDPLSNDGGSPWKTWFAHLDLRATIRQDVDRTFPDIPYFAQEHVRRALTTMLFLFAITNPDVGYRQVRSREAWLTLGHARAAGRVPRDGGPRLARRGAWAHENIPAPHYARGGARRGHDRHARPRVCRA